MVCSSQCFPQKISSKSYAEVPKHGKHIMVDKTDHNSVWLAVSKAPLACFLGNTAM